MKFTTILLAFLAVTISSCNTSEEGTTENPADSTKIDTVKDDDQRLEVIDTLKKKTVSTLYTSKCNAFKRWSES